MGNDNKLVLIVILGMLTASGPLSVDMYLAGLPAIETELLATSSQVQLTLGIFLIGLGVGQLLYGPLSDRFGRKPLLVFGIVLYIFSSLLCAIATNIQELLIYRMLQALGASTGFVLSRAIVRDLFSGNEISRILSFISLITLTAPLVAPVLGGYMLVWLGWRSVFYTLSGFGVLCLLVTLFGFEESHLPEKRQPMKILGVLHSYIQVLSHPQAVAQILCSAFAVGVMFAFLTGAPYVFIDFFGIAPQNFGYVISISGTGLILGALANGRLVLHVGIFRMLSWGLWLRVLGSVSLFFVIYFGIGGAVAVISCFFICAIPGNIIMSNTAASVLQYFPQISGAASAVIGATSIIIGSLAGVQVAILHDGTVMPMASTILTFSILSLLMYWLYKKHAV